jgi:hypothetical protein
MTNDMELDCVKESPHSSPFYQRRPSPVTPLERW